MQNCVSYKWPTLVNVTIKPGGKSYQSKKAAVESVHCWDTVPNKTNSVFIWKDLLSTLPVLAAKTYWFWPLQSCKLASNFSGLPASGPKSTEIWNTLTPLSSIWKSWSYETLPNLVKKNEKARLVHKKLLIEPMRVKLSYSLWKDHLHLHHHQFHTSLREPQRQARTSR